MIKIADYVKCDLEVTGKKFLGSHLYYDKNDLITIALNKYGETINELSIKYNKKNDKYGYIDLSGNEVIPCIYDMTWGFKEGLALVRKNGKYGYINSNNILVIPFQFDLAEDFNDGLAYVEIGINKYFINKQGEIAFSCNYEEVQNFSEGLAMVRKNYKYGFINTNGKLVIPCVYDSAKDFSEGLALVDKHRNNCFSKKNKYNNCYIDKKGKTVLNVKAIYTKSFQNDLAVICDLNGKYGYINKQSEIAIPCVYGNAFGFMHGLGIVINRDDLFNSSYGIVDKNGKVIIPLEHESLEIIDEDLIISDNHDVISFLNSENQLLPITVSGTFYLDDEKYLEKIIGDNRVEKLEKKYYSIIEIDDETIFISADNKDELNIKKSNIIKYLNEIIDESTNKKIAELQKKLQQENELEKEKINESIITSLDSEYQKVLKK